LDALQHNSPSEGDTFQAAEICGLACDRGAPFRFAALLAFDDMTNLTQRGVQDVSLRC
jgi:hypothetical protein